MHRGAHSRPGQPRTGLRTACSSTLWAACFWSFPCHVPGRGRPCVTETTDSGVAEKPWGDDPSRRRHSPSTGVRQAPSRCPMGTGPRCTEPRACADQERREGSSPGPCETSRGCVPEPKRSPQSRDRGPSGASRKEAAQRAFRGPSRGLTEPASQMWLLSEAPGPRSSSGCPALRAR